MDYLNLGRCHSHLQEEKGSRRWGDLPKLTQVGRGVRLKVYAKYVAFVCGLHVVSRPVG